MARTSLLVCIRAEQVLVTVTIICSLLLPNDVVLCAVHVVGDAEFQKCSLDDGRRHLLPHLDDPATDHRKVDLSHPPTLGVGLLPTRYPVGPAAT